MTLPSIVKDTDLQVIEYCSSKPRSMKETSLIDDNKTSGASSTKSMHHSVPEILVSQSPSTSSYQEPAKKDNPKWFHGSENNKMNTGSIAAVSRSGSRASKQSNEFQVNGAGSNRMHGKRTIRGIMKRGRTIRKTMKGRKINGTETSEENSTHGHILTNEQKLRMYVLREIVNTEEEYTKLLQFIVDVMIPSLNQLANDENIPTIDGDTVTRMLCNIEDIHQLHVKFLSSLKEATHPYPYYTNGIGKVFLQYGNKFAVYGRYCANFSQAQKFSYRLEEDPIVLNLIKEWKESTTSKTRSFLHLEGFIISPVQRLCKYPLLLKKLLEFTNENHDDRQELINAKEVMERVTKAVNETERHAIAVQAIRDLEDSCDAWEKSGCMLKHGFMVKQGGSFKAWNIRWFTLNGFKMSYFHEPTDTKPLGVLDLTTYKSLEESTPDTGRPYSFGIKMPDRTYYMYTVNEQEKREWLTILKWKFNCIDRSRRQAHRPLETVIIASLSSFMNPKEKKSVIENPKNPVSKMPSNNVPATNQQPDTAKVRRTKSFFSAFSRKRNKSKSTVSLGVSARD